MAGYERIEDGNPCACGEKLANNRLTWIAFGFLIVVAVAMTTMDMFVVFICLDEYLKPNSMCQFNNTQFQQFVDVIEILEPLISVVLVTFCVLLYYRCQPRCRCAGQLCACCCFRHCRSCGDYLLKNMRNCCKTFFCSYSWTRSRSLMLLIVCLYNFFISVTDTVDSPSEVPPLRYAILPLGLTSWYVLLVISNEKGPLASRYDDPKIHLYVPIAIFLFACITNLAEFITDTVYLSLKLYSIFSDTDGSHTNILHVMDILGMTAKVVLRLDFSKYFWNMSHLSVLHRKYLYGGKNKILKDLWEDWETVHVVATQTDNDTAQTTHQVAP